MRSPQSNASLEEMPADGSAMWYPNAVIPYTENANCTIKASQNTGIDCPKNASVVIV